MNEIVRVDSDVVDVEYKVVSNPTYTDDKVIALFIATKRSDNTKVTYTNSIQMFVDYMGKPLGQVTLPDAVDYHVYLKEKYSSKHSVKLHVNVVKSLYTFAIQLNVVGVNPFAAIKVDTPDEITHKRIIDSEDVIRLINAPKQMKHRVMLRLLYVTGMRVSELTSITWGDINNQGVLAITGKGQKQRFVTLSEKTLDALYKIRNKAHDDTVIFPVTTVAVDRLIKRYAVQVGITEDVSAHWLRHAHASHALDNGANLVDVRDTLGHGSIATTNKYLHGKRQNSSSLKLGL